MTQLPFQPSRAAADADHLNTLLDALVSGKRAPAANGASDEDAFAAVHRLVRGDSDAEASATPSEDTLDQIWRTVMHQPAAATATVPDFTPPQSHRQRAHLRTISERPRMSRFQTFVSMAAVAAMLILLIGAAWIGRDGNGPADPEPGRYAAVPLETGTPEETGWTASAPLSPDEWMAPITEEECVAEPMTSGEYVDIIQSDMDVSWRSYEMIGPPAPGTTADAISAVRNYTACAFAPYGEYDVNETRSLATDAYLRAGSNQVSGDEAASHRESDPAYEDLEAHFLALPRSSFKAVLESEAPREVQEIWERRQEQAATPGVSFGPSGEDFVYAGGYPYGIDVFDPRLAVELDDGRVALPMTTLHWADDPDIAWLDASPYSNIVVYVMAEEDGEWLLDEEIWICAEGCEPIEFTPDVLVGDEGANLENAPRLQSGGMTALPAGTPLMILSSGDPAVTMPDEERLVFVQTEDGRLGWVRQVDIVPNAPAASPVATPGS